MLTVVEPLSFELPINGEDSSNIFITTVELEAVRV